MGHKIGIKLDAKCLVLCGLVSYDDPCEFAELSRESCSMMFLVS